MDWVWSVSERKTEILAQAVAGMEFSIHYDWENGRRAALRQGLRQNWVWDKLSSGSLIVSQWAWPEGR